MKIFQNLKNLYNIFINIWVFKICDSFNLTYHIFILLFFFIIFLNIILELIPFILFKNATFTLKIYCINWFIFSLFILLHVLFYTIFYLTLTFLVTKIKKKIKIYYNLNLIFNDNKNKNNIIFIIIISHLYYPVLKFFGNFIFIPFYSINTLIVSFSSFFIINNIDFYFSIINIFVFIIQSFSVLTMNNIIEI